MPNRRLRLAPLGQLEWIRAASPRSAAITAARPKTASSGSSGATTRSLNSCRVASASSPARCRRRLAGAWERIGGARSPSSPSAVGSGLARCTRDRVDPGRVPEQAREEVAHVDARQPDERAADRRVTRLEEDDDPEHRDQRERDRHEAVRTRIAAERARRHVERLLPERVEPRQAHEQVRAREIPHSPVVRSTARLRPGSLNSSSGP
jgi:hypothetical protein